MSCGHCVMRVTKALKAVEGVSEATVDLASGNITVDYDGGGITRSSLEDAIRKAGYQVV
ncbi:MAG: heavy-metal-associated domain-containing protein [Nitrospirae bacterium]|nr:heavy-metal-associated domain-containing protein [Nitrospirota bacterium]